MRTALAGLALASLAACSENEVSFNTIPPDVPTDGEIIGQLCNEELQVWLEGATVYTHLYDDGGVVYDTVTDVTDVEGRFSLAVPSLRTYDVYVAYGNEIVSTYQVEVGDNEQVEIPPPACFGDVELSVAVVTGAYDDLAVLFQTLGIATYKEVNGQATSELEDFLRDPAVMAEYQVIFFDGGHKEDGFIYPSGDPLVEEIRTNLRTYVQNGGVVFASDWAYDVVEQTWPAMVDFLGDDADPDAAQKGEPGDVNAVVADEFMSAALGFGQVTVAYDMSVYPVIEGVDPGTRVYLTGDIPWRNGQAIETLPASPIAVSFEDGSGRVYFTGYRNAANGAGDMLETLRYLLDAVQ